MKTAFIVLKSPQEGQPAHTIRRFAAKPDASIILFEDGIYHALLPKESKALADASSEILVSRDDLEARGFSESDLKLGKAVGYDDVVDCIMERTERTVTV